MARWTYSQAAPLLYFHQSQPEDCFGVDGAQPSGGSRAQELAAEGPGDGVRRAGDSAGARAPTGAPGQWGAV